MPKLRKFPPDGLSVFQLQAWASQWSEATRRYTAEYVKDTPFMHLEDWLARARDLHWRQERAAEAYRRARGEGNETDAAT